MSKLTTRMALTLTALLVLCQTGCGVQELQFQDGTEGDPIGVSVFIKMETFDDADAMAYILQSSSNGGAVAFGANMDESLGSGANPVTLSCCMPEILLTPVSDGQVTLRLFNVAFGSAALVDELSLEVFDGVIYYGAVMPLDFGDPNDPTIPSNPLPNPVQSLTVAVDPANGAGLLAQWLPTGTGTDEYRITYERADGQSVDLGTQSATQLAFDPMGALGAVRVVAINANGASDSREAVVRIFGYSGPIGFSEPETERSQGPAGVQWSDGAGLGVAPAQVTSQAEVADIYVTNFRAEPLEPYYLASSHLAATSDVDGPQFNTVNGLPRSLILDLGETPPDVVPDPGSAAYADQAEIVPGHYYAVSMPDGRYGVVLIESAGIDIDRFVGTMRAWATPLRESRLFGLESTP